MCSCTCGIPSKCVMTKLIYVLFGVLFLQRMYVTGTSLGGNVMTKFLGELGEDAPKYGILGGAVACVPTSDNSAIDDDDFNRRVYSKNFLKVCRRHGSLQPCTASFGVL